MKQKLVSIGIALLGLTQTAIAANLLAITSDGENHKWNVDDVQVIMFNSDQNMSMNIKTFEGQPYGQYRSINFHPTKDQLKGAGTDDVQNIQLSVYPNPVSEYITIHGAGEDVKSSVINMQGVVVKENIGSNVDVRSLSAGEYILKIESKTVKFLKK